MFHPTQIEALATLRHQERLRAADQRRLVRAATAPRRRPSAVATFPAARWFGAPVDEAGDDVRAERPRRAGVGGPAPHCC